jgi:hypothetical protein
MFGHDCARMWFWLAGLGSESGVGVVGGSVYTHLLSFVLVLVLRVLGS